jgi:hypothetical protein
MTGMVRNIRVKRLKSNEIARGRRLPGDYFKAGVAVSRLPRKTLADLPHWPRSRLFPQRFVAPLEAAIRMKISGLVCVLIALGGGSGVCDGAQARQRSIVDQLMRLSPEARLEQRCNGRATGLLAREHKLKAPDEVLAYAFADTSAKGAYLDAPGAAIRDRGEWYRLSYKCQATPDGLNIVTFEYKLGAKVPRTDWAKHNLSPP